MKRNKSIRKSIAKKLRRKRDEPDGIQLEMERKESIDTPREPLREPPRPVQVETRTSIGSKIDGGTRVEVIKVVEKDKKDLVGDTQPLPGHIEAEVPRKMDKLRRSIRNRPYTIQNIEYTIYNVQYILHNMQYILYNIEYRIYNIQYTIYIIQYTIYVQHTKHNAQYTIYNIQYMNNMQNTMYNIQ